MAGSFIVIIQDSLAVIIIQYQNIVMFHLIKTIVISTIFSVFNIYVFNTEEILAPQGYSLFLYHMLIVIPITTSVFTLFLMIPYIGWIIVALCFLIGAGNSYFLYNFHKGLDTGVIADLLSVEFSLSAEYMTLSLLIGVCLFCAALLITFIYLGLYKSSEYRKCYSVYFILFTLLVVFMLSGLNGKTLRNILKIYQPHAVFYNIYEYVRVYKHYKELVLEKHDLTDEYSFAFSARDKNNPLLVILIIGESMRGDIISPKNMPRLFARENTVIFKNARSSGGSTKESLPYMLTKSVPPNFDEALQNKSVISIFDHLGFETSWIGNQGLFGVYESTFASHALEANMVKTSKEFQKFSSRPNKVVYDGDMFSTITNRIENVKGDHFMVIHLLGSHWKFGNNVPPGFITAEAKNKWCNHPLPKQCSYEQLRAEYEGSISYTDDVLDRVLKLVQDKNAVILYSSDHGMLLGEKGYIGNAHTSKEASSYQFDIAMFMWGSPQFINLYNDKYSIISSYQNKTISHDFIFHSLLDCIGVQSQAIINELSLCRE